MEIESKNGSKIQLKNPSETINFGRESIIPFDPINKTVSRHHISFKVNESQTSVDFKVEGKNPIWVLHKNTNEIKVYKCSENGVMKTGDSFCVCSKNPVWFHLKKVENDDDDEISRYDDVLEDSLEEVGFGDDVESCGDVIDIDDPIKEFGFVVMGHEFDSYPKKMIRDIRNWDWFLEEPKEESDDDEVSDRKPKKGSKRKKGGGRDDEDDDVWTGESEEDAEIIKKLKNDPKPKYPTRSKKQEKNKEGASGSRSVKDTKQKDAMDDSDDDEEDEDENDETLGGFIVDYEDVGEGDDDDEEEEEEFEEDDEEDE